MDELDKTYDNLLKKFECKTETKSLYHYTSLNGLIGILSSKSLWFSSIEYLNDKTEGLYIFKTIRKVLEQYDNDFKNLAYSLFSQLNNELFPPPLKLEHFKKLLRPKDKSFVCCFSINPDSLPLWNYYTKDINGAGYNIEFDRDKLINNIFPRDKFYYQPYIFKVIYNAAEQTAKIKEIIDTYYALWKNATSKTYKNQIVADLSYFIDDTRFLFKHPAFEHEEEIRIVIRVLDCNYNFAQNNAYIQTRKANKHLISYVPIKCIENEFVKSIKLSPAITNNEEILAEAKIELLELLKKLNIQCNITMSDIPIRY